MGCFVIAAYRPKPGRDQDLLAELREHLPILRRLGFATDRPSLLMRAKDATMVEVFEWQSEDCVAQAHENDTVKQMWDRFAQVCDYVTLSSLDEAQGPFPHFDPVDL